MESAGRWALINRARPKQAAADELRERSSMWRARCCARYGVVFWRLLAREAGWLPPWRDLLRVYRRLEARGEIRGGRFVAGFSGEQFALARRGRTFARDAPPARASGAMGVAVGRRPAQPARHPDARAKLSALTATGCVYRDGLPVAALTGGKTQFLTELETADQWEAEKRLVRSAARGRLADLV